MEYTIQALANLAGVSARTLRYYDQIGLLRPARITQAGYRIYEARQVDQLQQILLYKGLGMQLSDIHAAMTAPDFDRLAALTQQLSEMQRQRQQMNLLIDNLIKTIETEKGLRTMTDKEKFEGFQRELVAENERKYGAEIREKYGDETVDASNARMLKLTQEQYKAMQDLAADINSRLESAVAAGVQPDGPEGREIAALHRDWLGYTWAHYSREAHIGLGNMYVEDERFRVYYDGNQPGCAEFLRDAIELHL